MDGALSAYGESAENGGGRAETERQTADAAENLHRDGFAGKDHNVTQTITQEVNFTLP